MNHPIRKALQKLQTGDRLQIAVRHDHRELVYDEGISVARRSKIAQVEWESRIGLIREIQVIAMVRWYRQDISDKTFRSRFFGDSREEPVVEFCIEWLTDYFCSYSFQHPLEG